MDDNLGNNHISSWKDLRKGNWPMLDFLNIEVNKAASMRWLTELATNSKMKMICINSMKKNQTINDYTLCGKLMAEPSELCKSDGTQLFTPKSK